MSYLLDLVRLSIDDVSIEKISGHIGQDPITTVEAIDSALPMLVGALSHSVRGDGASSLSSAVEEHHDGEILRDVAGYIEFADPAEGERLLNYVLGTHQDAAARVLGARSGLDRAQAASLMVTLAPVLMGAIGKAKKARKLGADGLSQLLSGEELDLERRSPGLMHAIWTLLDSGDEAGLQELSRQGARGLGRFTQDS